MGETALIFRAVYTLIFGIIASIAVTALYSYKIYNGFGDAEDAMNAYRTSCTHAFSHRFMRSVIMILSIGYAVWVVIKCHASHGGDPMPLVYSSVLLPVVSADLFILPSAKDTMARAKIFSHIRNKYSLKDSIINDWFVDLDEDEYPEELEIDIFESGNERCFIIDLEHRLIREESPYNK